MVYQHTDIRLNSSELLIFLFDGDDELLTKDSFFCVSLHNNDTNYFQKIFSCIKMSSYVHFHSQEYA